MYDSTARLRPPTDRTGLRLTCHVSQGTVLGLTPIVCAFSQGNHGSHSVIQNSVCLVVYPEVWPSILPSVSNSAPGSDISFTGGRGSSVGPDQSKRWPVRDASDHTIYVKAYHLTSLSYRTERLTTLRRTSNISRADRHEGQTLFFQGSACSHGVH